MFFIFFSLTVSIFSQEKSQQDISKIELRRNLLKTHQFLGFSTLILWLATNLEGEKALKNLYKTSDQYARYLLAMNPQYNKDPLYNYYILKQPDRHSFTAEYYLLQDPNKNLQTYLMLKSTEEWYASKNGERHKKLAYLTTVFYALTATTAFLAPEGIPTNYKGYDSLFFHKLMIPIHLSAMLLLPSLGEKIEHKGYYAALKMKQTGWIGFSALTFAFLSITIDF
jgi:hypothetical protein